MSDINGFRHIYMERYLVLLHKPEENMRGEPSLETWNLVKRAQAGDNTAIIALIEKFAPLLRKYAHKLSSEDGYNDLVLEFIELINHTNLNQIQQKNEGGIISYISTGIHNNYINHLTRIIAHQNTMAFSELSEDEQHYVDSISREDTSFDDVEFKCILTGLSALEAQVIMGLYYFGYSVSEIAKRYGTSRQAVNKTKKRALRKLRELLCCSNAES